MGDPIIDPIDELIDAKWYCVTGEFWKSFGPDWGCQGIGPNPMNCCRTGASIKQWKLDGGYCDINAQLCRPMGPDAERLFTLKGPYDTWAACNGDCPQMSAYTDFLADKLANDYGFYPVDEAKYEPLELAGNDWNFRIAKRYEDNTNCLFAVDGDILESA